MTKPRAVSLSRRFANSAAFLAGMAMLVVALSSWWLINQQHADAVRSLLKKDAALQAATVSDNLTGVAARMFELTRSNLIANALFDNADKQRLLIPYLSGIQRIRDIPVAIVFTDFEGREIANNGSGSGSFSAQELAWLKEKMASSQPAVTIQPGKNDGKGEVKSDELLAVEFVTLSNSNSVEGALLYKIKVDDLSRQKGVRLVRGKEADELLRSTRVAAAALDLPPFYKELNFAVVTSPEITTVWDDSQSLGMFLILTSGLVLAVVIIGQRLGKRLTRDLMQLQFFARNVSENGFGTDRMEAADSLEVSGLAQSINRMLDQLKLEHDKLSESEKRFRSLFEYSEIGMNVRNAGSEYVDVNPAFAEMMGYSKEELMGISFDKITHPDDIEPSMRNVKTLLTGERDYFQMEKKFIRKDGSILWADVTVSAVRDDARALLSFVGITQDITERKHAEMELLRFKSVLDNTLDMLFMFEPESLRFVYVNQGAIRSMGYSREELHGMTPHHVKPLIPEAKFRQLVAPLFSGEQSLLRFETLHRRKDGTDFPVSIFLQLVTQSDGSGLFVAIVQDITERKQAQDDMERLNASLEARVQQRTGQLQASNRDLEEFAYSVAHDLRQPFIAIGGFSGLLEKTATDERALHYIARIKAGVRQAGELTDALLALANLSRVQLHVQAVDISAIAHSVMATLQQQDPSRRSSISIQSALVVQADPTLVKLLMQELLGNAWKFTSRQSHTVISFGMPSAHASGVDTEPVYVVRDNGEGFDMAHADKLFRSFQRLHTDPDFSGAGTGLANMQRIVTRHNGRIWAESAPGEGTSFFFTLGTTSP